MNHAEHMKLWVQYRLDLELLERYSKTRRASLNPELPGGVGDL